MIVPIAVGLAAFHGRRAGGAERKPVWKLVPAFLVWFLLAAGIHSTGVVHARASHDLAWTATLLITIALAAIGLSTKVTELRRTGLRPLLLGTVLWAVVGISGLLLQSL